MTDQRNTEPAWIAEGAPVAVVSGYRADEVDYSAIARLLPTQIRLADGRRYARRGYFYELGGRSRLADPNDPSVVNAFARTMLRRFVASAERLTADPAGLINSMDAVQIRVEIDRLADLLNSTRKEIDRRARL